MFCSARVKKIACMRLIAPHFRYNIIHTECAVYTALCMHLKQQKHSDASFIFSEWKANNFTTFLIFSTSINCRAFSSQFRKIITVFYPLNYHGFCEFAVWKKHSSQRLSYDDEGDDGTTGTYTHSHLSITNRERYAKKGGDLPTYYISMYYITAHRYTHNEYGQMKMKMKNTTTQQTTQK